MTATTTQTHDAAVGRRLTEIALGVDALERAGAGAMGSERLIPIFIGTDLVAGSTFAAFDDALRALDTLAADVAAYPAGPRKELLSALVRSVRASTRFFDGEQLSFQEKLTELVCVPAEPVPDEQVADIHGRLDALLRQNGYAHGSLAERVQRWEGERFVDVADIPRVFDELMAVAQARTDAAIFPTGDYTMRLNPQRGIGYTARCSFAEGNMDINLDVAFTRSALKHLVCHEVFPGHSTQLLYTRAGAERGTSTPDVLLCTIEGATGSVQEGIGDQGIEMLDWVEGLDDATHIELRRLQTATGANAAWHRNVGGWSHEQTVQYLCEAGFGQRAWSEGRTSFAEHPFRGGFVASYWFGSEAVREMRERTAGPQRAAFVKYLYERLHTPRSVRMFAA